MSTDLQSQIELMLANTSSALDQEISTIQQLQNIATVTGTLQSPNGGVSVSSSPIDLSNATSDYMLAYDQTAIINYSNVTSVPLHIATQDGTSYELKAFSKTQAATINGGSASTTLLYPNNISNVGNVDYNMIYRFDGGGNTYNTVYNSFRMGDSGTFTTQCRIDNFTVNKIITGLYSCSVQGITWSMIGAFATVWEDTTTEWTSLGTIALPVAQSGVILIKRVL